MQYKTIEELEGQTITLIEQGESDVIIETKEGKRYRMYHEQNCCEAVYVDEVKGSFSDVYGSPVIAACEEIGHDTHDYGTCTLTTFHLITDNGELSIKWNGSSNGYYSESVYFVEM